MDTITKSTDGLIFTGLDYELTSIKAREVNIIGGLIVNDARSNIRMGVEAGLFLTTGSNNTCLGTTAGRYLTTGSENLVAGSGAGFHMSTADGNLIVGNRAGYNLASGQFNTFLGYKSGFAVETCESSVMIGRTTGSSLTGADSNFNVCVGLSCGSQATEIKSSVLIGAECGDVVNSDSSVCIGYRSGGATDAGTSKSTVCVGSQAGLSLVNASSNVFVGTNCARTTQTIQRSVMIGSGCGEQCTSTDGVILIGTGCGATLSGNNCLFMGECGTSATTEHDSIAIGSDCCTYGSGEYNIFVGKGCGRYNGPLIVQGNTVVGSNCMNIPGSLNVVFGHGCATGSVAGVDYSVLIGTDIMRYTHDTPTPTTASGIEMNVAFGKTALERVGDAVSYNVAIGDEALRNVRAGDSNTAIGVRAGFMPYGADNNILRSTFVGSYTEAPAGGCTGSTAIGYGALVTASNQMVLGSDQIKTLVAGDGTVLWSNVSDARRKQNIQDSALGLEFIKALNPVSFKYKDRVYMTPAGDIASKRYVRRHHGFIAQEVKSTIDRFGTDFAGYIDPTGRPLGLAYTEFIGPIIRAVQELAVELQRRINR